MKKISIGGGQGFWGDSNDAAVHMVHAADLNYMSCDYLAELTLSIMARQKLKHPEAGFARDFLQLLDECGEEAFRKKTRIITNAGGMNVEGCVREVKELIQKKNIHGYKIGYILGDDLLAKIPEMEVAGIAFENMDEVGNFQDIKDKLINANVYFGHEPFIECLTEQPDVIITGRATDSTMFLSPLV